MAHSPTEELADTGRVDQPGRLTLIALIPVLVLTQRGLHLATLSCSKRVWFDAD